MSIVPEPVSLNSALEKFISHLKSQKRSSATSIAYHSDLKQLRNHLNDRKITQATTVSTQHLEVFVSGLTDQNYTPKSISRKINSLKTFFKFLHSDGHIPSNPAPPLTPPQIEVHAPRFLSPAEVSSLRDVVRLDIRISAVIELLLQTGMRISELANLRLEDAKKSELHIRPVENNPARTIAVNRPASTSLHNYLAVRPSVKDNHIFVTKTGRPLLVRNIRTAIDRYFKKAEIKNAKVNDLRHTFIAHQLKGGVQPDLIHKHVGHRRLSSTQKYLDYITVDVTETHTRLLEL